MFDIKEELKKLPNSPGVYIMRDAENNIIYVGKAVVLKNRVRQYFKKTNKTERIKKMVSLIDHFEYIVTDNEAEALILECNLIKENRPKFNVLLKDDKTYPYIKIDIKDEFPGIYTTRRIVNDGAKYFGPYANPGSAKEMVSFIREKFKIKQCKEYKSNKRACLNYHIKRCPAPCMGYITKEEYRKQIDDIIDLLDGKTDKIIKNIESEMKEASIKQEYEKAAELRDRKIALEKMSQKQKVSNISENDIDVIGVYKNSFSVCVEMFFVRNSKMILREHYFFDEMIDTDENELVEEFIKQYYVSKAGDFPSKIMLRYSLKDAELLENWLSNMAGKKVLIKTPQKGEKLRFVEMAENNAKITLENKNKDKTVILDELKEKLKLEKLPTKIECYDISNISGSYMVAGMCVMENGVIKRNLSRRFKIKTVENQNDVECMKEVVSRRIKHSLSEERSGFGKLPDVIFADGGITQINAIKSAIAENEVVIPVFGMVKSDKHRTKTLIDDKKHEIEISEELFNLITNFQEEVHKVAIEYHKKVRDAEMKRSVLDEIDGIGEVKKVALLKKFGSVNKIAEASIEEIAETKGINIKIAEKIKKYIQR